MDGSTFADRILELHGALDQAHIGHAFGGAVALAYYVLEPRATRDIDLNIEVVPASGRRVLDAMPAGVAVPRGAAAVIRRDGQIRLWWGAPHEGIPVDLFFPQHAFHAEVARDAQLVPFLDSEIPIISATHLTVFKCLFNRPRDWPDIEAMLVAGSVNVEEVRRWLGRLIGEEAAAYLRFTELARAAGAGELNTPGSEMAEPRIDWRSL